LEATDTVPVQGVAQPLRIFLRHQLLQRIPAHGLPPVSLARSPAAPTAPRCPAYDLPLDSSSAQITDGHVPAPIPMLLPTGPTLADPSDSSGMYAGHKRPDPLQWGGKCGAVASDTVNMTGATAA
jgi:hypothetical protein